MIIYIVWYENFHSVQEFHSAHSTEALARAAISRYSPLDQRSFTVEPYTLDSE
jgi:hypothetical protein